MLHLRVLSALLGAPLILAAAYLGGVYYSALLLLVAVLGMREFQMILKLEKKPILSAAGFAGAALLLFLSHSGRTDLLFPAAVLLLLLLFTGLLPDLEAIDIRESALMLWGIIYLGGLGSYMILLRALPGGAEFTFALLAGVWINDTLAYFAGVRWGRHKLAPRISPKKSVEGALAGFAGTILVAVLAARFLPGGLAGLDPGRAALLGALISLCAMAGDFLESALKRQARVKDSGRLIPGHGGVLDRFDSLLVAAPFVFYFFLLYRGSF